MAATKLAISISACLIFTLALALVTAGKVIPAKMAMMAITTKSSMSVKALFFPVIILISISVSSSLIV
jgi:hypothetical protein